MASTSTSNSGGPPEEPVRRTDVTFLAGDDPTKIIFTFNVYSQIEVIYTTIRTYCSDCNYCLNHHCRNECEILWWISV